MEILLSFYPNMITTNHLIPKIFGCVFFMHVHNPNKGKLDPRVIKCIFVGYSSTQKGYKCYHPPLKFFFVSDGCYLQQEWVLFFRSLFLGENIIKEDKDQDSHFIDPFIIDTPKVFDPVSNPISIPSFSEPELSSNESTLEN